MVRRGEWRYLKVYPDVHKKLMHECIDRELDAQDLASYIILCGLEDKEFMDDTVKFLREAEAEAEKEEEEEEGEKSEEEGGESI